MTFPNPKQKPALLLKALDDLTWETYVQLSDDLLKIDRLDLEKELANQAIMYAYYHGMLTEAKKRESLAEVAFATQAGKVRSEYRQEHIADVRKPTAPDMQAAVDADPIVNLKKKELAAATEKVDYLKGLVRSMEQRKDCLIQLSSNARAEIKLNH